MTVREAADVVDGMSVRVAWTRPLLIALAIASSLAMGCDKKKKKTDPPIMDTGVEQPILNLFGFEESYIHRINFNVQQRGRLILVHYDPTKPHDLAILDCPVVTQYQYLPSDGTHVETMQIRNEAELKAKVPMGVARFGGYVKAGSALEFKYATVGSFQVAVDPTVPGGEGDCAEATHYVASLSVGAFTFSEMRGGGAGVSVGVAGGPGVETNVSRERGATRSWGDLAACEREDPKGCRTPTQMLLLPLHTSAADAATAVAAATEPATAAAVAVEPETQSLRIDEEQWRPGHHMATALEKALQFSSYIEESTEFGFDGDATAIFGGVLSDAGLSVIRPLRADRQYIVFAAASHDVDIDVGVFDADGKNIVVDNANDSQPLVSFTPPADGNYRILVAPGSAGLQAFVGAGILNNKDGFRVPPKILKGLFQSLLDSGSRANTQVGQIEGRSGLIFHAGPGEWSLLGTFLNPGEKITMPGIHLPGSAVIISAAHDQSLDIDAAMHDGGGRHWEDKEKDAVPILVVDDPTPNAEHALEVSYAKGTGVTLAGSLILIAQ